MTSSTRGSKLFEDGKEKVTDFVESEKGQELVDKSKNLFEDGKEKVTDFVESEKGQQIVDKSKSVFEDGKEKVTDFFGGDKADQGGEPVADDAVHVETDAAPGGRDDDAADAADTSDRVFDSAADKAKKITPDEQNPAVDDVPGQPDRAVGDA